MGASAAINGCSSTNSTEQAFPQSPAAAVWTWPVRLLSALHRHVPCAPALPAMTLQADVLAASALRDAQVADPSTCLADNLGLVHRISACFAETSSHVCAEVFMQEMVTFDDVAMRSSMPVHL